MIAGGIIYIFTHIYVVNLSKRYVYKGVLFCIYV